MTGEAGDSGGNNQALEEQHIWYCCPSTSYYDFWNPKFEDFFRAERDAGLQAAFTQENSCSRDR